MSDINGRRTRVSTKSHSGINGGVSARINANMPYEYNKWQMNWNGNQFAPPNVGSQLYLPGVPGFGSTIFDFSSNFLDSAINTNEELDDSETGVDVTPDGTTALPVGSVIRVEEELMYVSATGNTLTVIRGFENSTAATHTTGKDIYKRTQNNGTITGATWKQTVAGLWYLDFDGTNDDVLIATGSFLQLQRTDSYSVLLWFKTDTAGQNTSILSNQDSSAPNSASINFIQQSNKFTTCYLKDNSSNTISKKLGDATWSDDVWHFFTTTYAGTSIQSGLIQYMDSIEQADDGGNTDTLTDTIASVADISLAQRANGGFGHWKGGMVLQRILNTVLTPAQISSIYNQERHLFGV